MSEPGRPRPTRVRLTIRGRDALDAYMIALYLHNEEPDGKKLALNAAMLAKLVLGGEVERTDEKKDEVKP